MSNAVTFETRAQLQIEKQRRLWSFSRGRALDFTPFDEALRSNVERMDIVAAVLQDASIATMRTLQAQGVLTARELVLHHVRRIRQQSPLNAVLELNPDALIIADQLDAERGSGKVRGGLHGIPILLKDNIGTGDRMHTTAGAAALRNARCDRDAFLAQRLWAHGALFLGKANLSEWANFMADEPPPNGFSALGGQTRNPHGAFDVGGSSSGSGAATAAQLCAAAVGSETHGSIVYPSLRNGVCGLKPSLGLVSRDRVIPITDATDTAGPMARSMADLATLMSGLVGHDASDPACLDAATHAHGRMLQSADYAQWLQRDGLRGVHLGVIDNDQQRDGSDDCLAAVRRALVDAGAMLSPVRLPKLQVPFGEMLNHGYVQGVAHYLQSTGASLRSVAEVEAFNALDPAHRAPNGMARMRAALAQSWTNAQYAETVTQSRAAARALIEAVRNEHKLDLFVSFDQGGYDAQFVMAGAPLLAVPTGRLASGEPFGVTFAGGWLEDDQLLRAGAALEFILRSRSD